jgi:hypothetical protein
MKAWWKRLRGWHDRQVHCCPLCGTYNCPSVEHAEEWEEIMAW